MALDPLVGIFKIIVSNLIPFLFLILWDAIWKGIGLWKAGRNNQFVWFLVIFILNTAGILPIIYLLFFQKKKKR